MSYIIEILGLDSGIYVAGYSNTYAEPMFCVRENAKRFLSEGEAKKWAKAYLPGYKYLISVVP